MDSFPDERSIGRIQRQQVCDFIPLSLLIFPFQAGDEAVLTCLRSAFGLIPFHRK